MRISAGQLQTEVIADVSADIWIVTEAPAQVPLTGFATADSAPMLTLKPAVFTTIAAAELTPLPMPEVPTGSATPIEASGKHWLVIGIWIPWRVGSPVLPLTPHP